MVVELAEYSDGFIYSLTPFHAIGFGVALFLSLMLLLAAIYWAYRAKLSLLLQMAALGMLIAGPILAYHLVEALYKPARFENITTQNLYYQDKMLVRGVVVNEASIALSECQIRIRAFEPATGPIDRTLKLLSPVATGKKQLQFALSAGAHYPFEVEVPGPTYEQNLSIAINLRCR